MGDKDVATGALLFREHFLSQLLDTGEDSIAHHLTKDSMCVSPQPCYERVKDWLNENLVALWIFALCTALTQVKKKKKSFSISCLINLIPSMSFALNAEPRISLVSRSPYEPHVTTKDHIGGFGFP